MNVSGRLFSRPMIAAANADRISRVSVCTSRVASSSARKMPATAAIDEPSAHENIETRPGLMPLRPASSRLSTTARIATPRRVRESRILSPSARPSPTTMVMKRDHGMSVSPIWKPLVPKKRLMWRVSCGSQIRPARPMRASMRPIGGDDLRDQRRVGDRPHEHALDDRAHERRGDEHGEQQGDEGLDAPVDLELPEHVGEEHADRALGEVEDARRRVGDDEAGGGDRVHRAVGDADDQPEQDRVERDRAAGPRLHARRTP